MSPKAQKRLFGILFVIITFSLLALIPAVSIAVNEDTTTAFEQDRYIITKIEDNYYSNITSYDYSNQRINITILYNETSYETVNKQLNLSEEKEFAINSENINVTFQSNISNTTKFIQYNYSPYLNIPQMAEIVIEQLPLILISLYILILSFGVIIISRSE